MYRTPLVVTFATVGLLLAPGYVLAAEAGGATASTTQQAAARVSAADKEFAATAAEDDRVEIVLGKMAAEKAASEDVKKFGERLVEDHTNSSSKLKKIAAAAGIDLPDKWSSKNEERVERLSKLSGRELDRAYTEDMVEDHTKAVDLFQRQAEQGQHPELKSFAVSTLPILEGHLAEARELQAKVK
jgi:putative membrane protein